MLAQKKKRGPAPTGKGQQIVVRMQPEPLQALDSHIGDQKEPVSRPEAIRTIVTKFLRAKGYLPK